jgi:type IV pilus biogenesis protein CpaD/CtpE
MMRIHLLLAVLLLAGCTTIDPYQRKDIWSPKGVNAGNIAVMVANPHDLIQGRGQSGEEARQGAGAIDRVWMDRPKPLLPTGSASAGGASAGGGAGASGGGN